MHLASFMLVLALAIPAHAALIPMGDSTLDTETHLEWVRTELTVGISRNALAAGAGGWFAAGWRPATEAEVQRLFRYGDGFALLLVGLTIDDFTPAHRTRYNSGTFGAADEFGTVPIATAYHQVFCEESGACESEDFAVYQNSFVLGSEALPSFGHLLVRESAAVPEPGTLALVVGGIAWLSATGRRRR